MSTTKEKIKRNFSASAPDYDKYADVQNEMRQRLFSMIEGDHKKILDIGAGTGVLAGALAEKYPLSEVIGVDVAEGMVRYAASKIKRGNLKFLVGDAEKLPFENATFDLVVSNASLQWMEAERAIAEIARVLGRKGEFYFSTFGPETMREIRKAGLSVNEFVSGENLKLELGRHFSGYNIEKKLTQKSYEDVFVFFEYLKRTGAQNPARVTSKTLLTPSQIRTLFPGGAAVTFEMFFGRAAKSA